MTLVEFITSWTAIISAGILSAITTLLFVSRKKHRQLLEWKAKHLWSRYDRFVARIKRLIRKYLKKNEYFMKWLNKPVKHGKPDAEFIEGQIKVFGDSRI